MNFRELLLSPTEYLPPEQTLDGLSEADALRRIDGAPHSIAEIVAHLVFWQDWLHARCLGEARPLAASAADGWPEVADSWDAVRSRFIEGLQQIAVLSEGDVARAVSPPIEFPPLANYTVGDALAHVVTHNAHHWARSFCFDKCWGRGRRRPVVGPGSHCRS